MSVSRASIFASVGVSETVDVPEWGGPIAVRPLLLGPLHDVLTRFEGDHQRRSAELVVRSIYSPETGERLCSDDDGPALLAGAAGAGIARLVHAVYRLNGLTPESRDELGKASAPTPTGASSSDSPAI